MGSCVAGSIVFIALVIIVSSVVLLLNIVGVTTGCQPTYIKYYLLTKCVFTAQCLIQQLGGDLLIRGSVIGLSHLDHPILPAPFVIPDTDGKCPAHIKEFVNVYGVLDLGNGDRLTICGDLN